MVRLYGSRGPMGRTVMDGSPAARGGLRAGRRNISDADVTERGDVIVAINGKIDRRRYQSCR